MAKLALLGLILLASGTNAANVTVSLTFNETLKGFGTVGGSSNDTIADFQRAYVRGKGIGESMSFSLVVNISDIDAWAADPLHNALCSGMVTESAITPMPSGLPVDAGSGSLHVFDGGVLPTHELRMEYALPFTTAAGKHYTLYGVKHLPGDDCLGILSQATTLYVHMLDTDKLKQPMAIGSPPPPGAILRSGIVKIGAGDVISLIASMRLHGGTLVDQIKGFLTFGLLLLGDVVKNCLAKGAYETDFWYFWSSDRSTGVLLDMVKRPTTLELRLAQYAHGTAPVVTRQFLPLSDFSLASDNVTVTMGKDLTMSPTGIAGTVGGVPLNVSFALDGRTNSFLPPVISALGLDAVLPKPVSAYGGVGAAGGRVGARALAAGVPMVKTTYRIPYLIDALKWVMISAMRFDAVVGDTAAEAEEAAPAAVDLQVELVALPLSLLPFLPPSAWVAPVYVRVDGKEYHLDTLDDATASVDVTADGKLSPDNTVRTFGVAVQLPARPVGAQRVQLNCSAPASAFAFLDQEGKTMIHTTTMGDCDAAVVRVDASGAATTTRYRSLGRNLLEIKA